MKLIKISVISIALASAIMILAIAIYEVEAGRQTPKESNDEEINEVIQVGEWYTLECFPGSVSGINVILSQHNNVSDSSYDYYLYIDGEFHSEGVSLRTIPINGKWYAGFLFDEWDTTSYENGLHELQIYGENGELVDSLLVFVQN